MMGYGNYLGGYFEHGMGRGFHCFGYGGHIFGGIGLILILGILIITFLYFKKKKNNHIIESGNKVSEAEELLKTRYVNGEITEEEYEQMKKVIQS